MTGLALADTPEDGTSVASTAGASADPRGSATRPGASRAATPARESRADRAPRATGVQQSRAAAAEATVATAETGVSADAPVEPTAPAPVPVLDLPVTDSGDSTPPDTTVDPVDPVEVIVDVPAVTDPGTVGEPEWAYYTSAPGDIAEIASPEPDPQPWWAPAASDRPVRVPATTLSVTAALQGVGQFLDGVINWLSTLPANPISDFVAGALMLVRRGLPDTPNFGNTQIIIPELDSTASTLGVRVDKTQASADGIKVNVTGKPFTLTLPGPASNYTVVANKPALVDIVAAGNNLAITAKTPGFLGLAITAKDGTASRYLGLYIGDQTTGVVPDMATVNGKPPVGTIALTDDTGNKFLEDFNFRTGVAPIDYLYIYDQGGADYTDANVTKLLTQAVQHGMVPVVVFYNIQAVNTGTGSASKTTGIAEGASSAYQAINEYNWTDSQQTDPTMFTGYMTRYFTKLGKDFKAMNDVGVPVQVVMEPDFLGYMATQKPSYQVELKDLASFPEPGTTGLLYLALDTRKLYQWSDGAYVPASVPLPVPDDKDRTQNYANVMKPMTDAGLLTAADPQFANTIKGMVTGINYYVGKNLPNLRIGWKTNIWAVAAADFQNQKMGLMHETDSITYPWQNQWTAGVGWETGRATITKAASNLGSFLKDVGVTYWEGGSKDRTPFLTIDKYGVDGGYLYDPQWNDAEKSGTNALVDVKDLIYATQTYCATACDEKAVEKYFGLSVEKLKAAPLDVTNSDFQTAATSLQAAAKADPNVAKWLFNADQWNNYLLMVKTLSTTVGTPVMLWQIPQGHINGSTTITGRDLANISNNIGCPSGQACGFEDSATSYFLGDTFTAADGRLDHFKSNQAGDSSVTVTGDTVTWGEHMTAAGQSGVMSVLFGAGLGPSTRGAPTPAGDVTDLKFWFDKATGYLTRPSTN